MDRTGLVTSVPIFTDWKSHPYKDVDLLEWYERVKLVKRIYSGNISCDSLINVLKKYKVTHIVTSKTYNLCSNCIESVYSDTNSQIFKIRNCR